MGFRYQGIEFVTDGPAFLYAAEADMVVRAYRKRSKCLFEAVARELGICGLGRPSVDCRSHKVTYGSCFGPVSVRFSGLFEPPYSVELVSPVRVLA